MFEDFLSAVDLESILNGNPLNDNSIANHIQIFENEFPDLEGVDIAIIGVKEDRKSIGNDGCGTAPDEIRRYFYRLDKSDHPIKIADLGNLQAGASVNDTYVAIGKIVSELIAKKILPVIIGGGHDLTYGQYLGYVNNQQIINMAVIDETIDIYKHEEEIDNQSFLYRIFTESPNYLFNFSQIGYQSYFVSPEDIETLEKLYFDFYRLGRIRENFEEVEPIVRDADMVSFDISAIRQSDAPAKKNATPNGFFGEEACRISRYAGITDKVTSIGFYETNPGYDVNHQTTHLVAQMIWYFVDGFYNRTNEFPVVNEKDFVKYIVHFRDNDHELIFWKSKRSGRWWMQVPTGESQKYERHQLVPCSYADYTAATKEEIPERWLRAYEKIS